MRSSKCNEKQTDWMLNELEKGGSTMAIRMAKQKAKEKRDIIGHASKMRMET